MLSISASYQDPSNRATLAIQTPAELSRPDSRTVFECETRHGGLLGNSVRFFDTEAFIHMSRLSIHEDSDRQANQSRRQFLLGLGVATAGMAGCLSSGDSKADPSPTDEPTAGSFDVTSELPYGEWLTAADDGLFFAYASLADLPLQGGSDGRLDESLEDPLVAYPLLMNQIAVGLGQLQLSFAGLTRAIDPESTSDSTVREVTVVNKTVVAEGTFVTDKLDRLLTDPTDETWGIAYEKSDIIDGYDQYEPAKIPESFDDDPPVVALTDEIIVVSPETDRLEQIVAGENGTQSRIYETDATVAQLLAQAGAGDLVVGEIGSSNDGSFDIRDAFDREPQFEPRSSEDVVAALEFGPNGDSLEARFALAADDLKKNRREGIKTAFGTAAVDDSGSITVNGDYITASGTYESAKLGLTSGDESGDEKLSQATARNLVPTDTLAFRYEPPRDQQFGELWVAVREDVDAAAIKLEAASGGATEIQPQERSVTAGDSIAVPVDPNGDSVTVFAVNDEGAVGRLTTQSVPTDELSESAASQAVPADAFSFSYEAPSTGDHGSLTAEITADLDADTLVAQPQEAPGLFTDRIGSLTDGDPIRDGEILETVVEPDGDEVIIYASVGGATGEITRWQGPK